MSEDRVDYIHIELMQSTELSGVRARRSSTTALDTAQGWTIWQDSPYDPWILVQHKQGPLQKIPLVAVKAATPKPLADVVQMPGAEPRAESHQRRAQAKAPPVAAATGSKLPPRRGTVPVATEGEST